MSELKVSRGGEIIKVPFSQLRLDPDNERMDYGDLSDLESIRENGILEPLLCYKSKEDGQDVYFVVNGSRRLAFMSRLMDEGTEIAAPVRTFDPTKHYNKEQLVIQRFLRNEGKPFTPLEKAKSVGKLINFGWEEKTIAGKLGMSVAWVNDMRLLDNAPEKLKALVLTKQLSATLAVQQIKRGLSDVLVADIEAGKFADKSVEDELPFAPAPGELSKSPGKRAKITQSVIDGDKVNSLKELKNFRKFIDTAEEEFLMSDCRREAYIFILKVLDNEVTDKQILNWFKKD